MKSDTDIEQENILMAINPAYKRCDVCKKYIHIQKNINFQRSMVTSNNFIPSKSYVFKCCPVCNQYGVNDTNYIADNIEECAQIYNNLYMLKRNILDKFFMVP